MRTGKRKTARALIASPHHASRSEVDHLALLIIGLRPEWDEGLVRVVLLSHRDQCDASDLAIAALRAARNPDCPHPKWLGHRGPWWDVAITTPVYVKPTERCQICNKTEPDCYSQRPGAGDDHRFETPSRSASATLATLEVVV